MKYQLIYADPPWTYDDRMVGHPLGAEDHYNTQSLEWVKSLPVKDMIDKHATLFMWATSPLLKSAMEVIESWGFNYKTVVFVWSKITPNHKPVYNMGRWTMGNVEVVLLGTKGAPKRKRKDIKQLIIAPRGRHSAKPDLVRKLIVDLMGDVPRLELFARGDRDVDLFGKNRFDGWDLYGNQCDGNIKVENYSKREKNKNRGME